MWKFVNSPVRILDNEAKEGELSGLQEKEQQRSAVAADIGERTERKNWARRRQEKLWDNHFDFFSYT